jgi:HSP20 family molecular chaperone IbpA
LSFGINVAKVEANFHNGALKVKAPKPAVAQAETK